MKRPIVPFSRLIALLGDTFDMVSSNGDFEDGCSLIRGLYSELCEFRCSYRAKFENEESPL